eukprot:9468089-Pyramimonas_sp.AAC.1
MLSDGFRESDNPEIPIHGTSCAAFQALLKYLYTDCMEVEEDEVLFDLARLCDQYQVERLFTHCMHTLAKGITHQNAVMRLIQAHACCEGAELWAKLQSATKEYVARNLKEIWRDAKHTMELLVNDHPELFMEMMDGALRQ